MSAILVSPAVVYNAAVRHRHPCLFWFGNCSYAKLKVTYEIRKMLCPLCQHELVDVEYSGSRVFVKSLTSFNYVRDGWLPLTENGVTVWRVVDSGGIHRGRDY